MERSKPLELPKEWLDKIKRDALQKANDMHYYADGNDDILATYEAAAMTYAPWLYTCQTNYATLQARCDIYEKALKEIRYVHKSSDSSAAWQLNQAQNIAIQALSGEGKEVENDDDDNYDVDQAFSFMNE